MFEKIFGASKSSPLVEAAFRDVSSMLQQSERMLEHALAAVLDNRELEVDLDRMDDVVDEGERMVRRSVLQHLSVNPKQDLVPSLVLVSMVQDAERIGDFARGLAEIVPLATRPREGGFAHDLRALATRIQPQFKQCERAFREGDSALASNVITSHNKVKSDLLDYTRKVAESDLTADMAIVYAGAARILMRISAHLSNIASSVVQPYDKIRHGDENV